MTPTHGHLAATRVRGYVRAAVHLLLVAALLTTGVFLVVHGFMLALPVANMAVVTATAYLLVGVPVVLMAGRLARR